MPANGGLPYTNEGYDPQKNQQTLGYTANGIEGGGSAEFKYPHLQLRDVSCDVRSEGGGWETLLNSISLEAKGGEIVAILSTKCKHIIFQLYFYVNIFIYVKSMIRLICLIYEFHKV